MIAFLLILLILTNFTWYLIYKASKKMIDTYRNIIISYGEQAEKVMKKVDEIL